MYVDLADVNERAASHSDPGRAYPSLRDIPINKDMEVRIATLLEFKDPDVLRSAIEHAMQVNPQFCKNPIQIPNRVPLNFLRVKSQGEKPS